ncbi:hypothetical protein H5410_003678, partial [Solanum commersonii]
HDYKNAELNRSKDFKNPDLKGDVGKHLKTHDVCLNTAVGTSKQVSEKQHKNTNLNQLFEKPFTPRTPRNTLAMEPQTSTYADSLQNEKTLNNHVMRTYIENIYKIQTYLNRNPRSTTTKEPNLDYLTQKLQAPVEILYEEIKPLIQVIKIGLIKDMIIPDDIEQQEEIQKIEIPSFYANKRIIGISTIIQEDQLMIYSNSRELRKADMDEVQRWILSLLKPEERPTTRALKVGFISPELST